MRPLKRPELGTLALAGIFAAVLLSSIGPIADLDIWWHLASGKYIISSRTIPRYDIFSYTAAGKPWIAHAWLTEVLFYAAYGRFGYWGLALLKCLLVVSTFYLLFKRLSFSSGRALTVAFMVLLFGATNRLIFLRPFLFTWLFVAYFVYVLDLYIEGRTSERGLYALPLVTLLWANLHGGFVLGIALLALYSAGALLSGRRGQAKRLFYVALACAAASLINPYTYQLLLYPSQYVSETVHARFISEWQSPSFHSFSFYEALLLIAIVSLAGCGGGASAVDLLLLLVFTHLSLFAIRNVPLFAIVCGPIIAKCSEAALLGGFNSLLGGNLKKIDSRLLETAVWKANESLKLGRDVVKVFVERFIPAFLWTAAFLSILLFTYSYSSSADAFQVGPSKAFPEEATTFLLESGLEGNLYNSYGWGGYLIWRVYPRYRVFIDGRADMYGDFVYEYVKVSWIEPEIVDTLEKYNISIIFIPKEQALSVFLRESPSWRLEYEDELATIYVRSRE